MLGSALTFLVLLVGGVGIAAMIMALCARLVGLEDLNARSCVIAAGGFGLPLAAAAGLLRDPGTALPGVLVALAAIVIGVGLIRLAFSARLGQAIIIWIMNVCVWVLLSSLVIRMRG